MNTRSAENALVSVIVPTRNSDATLARCLESVRRQTYGYLELIVVDNDSRDGTLETAKALADRVISGGNERSTQRNLGARIAEGTHLLFIDSDMELEPAVVAECVDAAEHTDMVVLPEASVGSGFWSRCRALERSCYLEDETIEAARFLARETFFKVGGYDEELIAGEDWDLHGRARAAGARVGRAHSYVWHHEGKLRLCRLLAKKFYYGRFMGAYVMRHPSMARRQLLPIRPAFFRHWRRLVGHPLPLGGMILMKVCECGAAAAGFLYAQSIKSREARP